VRLKLESDAPSVPESARERQNTDNAKLKSGQPSEPNVLKENLTPEPSATFAIRRLSTVTPEEVRTASATSPNAAHQQRPANPISGNVPRKPKVGELFAPWRKLWNIYWPDVIGRRKDLSDGQKRLYEWLVRHAGEKATCWPSFRLLSEELGKSDKTIRKDAKVLSDRGLIRWKHRAERRSNTYEFLWAASFDREFERKWGTAQLSSNPESATGRGRENVANLSGTRGAWNSVTTELGSKKTSSSSELTADNCTAPLNRGLFDDDARSVEKAKGTTYEAANWLNGAPVSLSELHACQEAIRCELSYDHALQKARPEDFALPDEEITAEIARKYILGLEDFAHWLEHFRRERKNLNIRRNGRGQYAFFRTDAKNWHDGERDQYAALKATPMSVESSLPGLRMSYMENIFRRL